MKVRSLLLAVLWSLLLAPPGSAQTDQAAWQRDLHVLKSELPARHANLFFKISRADFLRRIDELEARLPALTDDERFVGLKRIVAAIGDSHTDLSTPAGASRLALPLMLYRFRDGLYVVNTTEAYKALLYGEVAAIGGRPVRDVERAIAEIVPHENDALVWMAIARFGILTPVLRGLGIIPDASRASISVRRSDGTTVTVDVAALPGPEPPQWVVHEADSGARPLSRRNSAAFYWFEYLPESNTVYVKYNACREMQDVPFPEFTRRVFEQIDRTEARLVVDVRDNGGGNSAIFGPFLEALQQRRAIGQQGRLLVIVGRRTFSSAILNAMALKQDHKGILVGEPTGGRPNHYGEVRSLALPGTGLNLTYSTKYFKTSAVDPASLEPDLRADNTIADYVAGRDAVLELALKVRQAPPGQMVPWFMSNGVVMKEALDYAMSGCSESRLPNREAGKTGNSCINYGAVLETTLRDGRMKFFKDEQFGLKTGDPRTSRPTTISGMPSRHSWRTSPSTARFRSTRRSG